MATNSTGRGYITKSKAGHYTAKAVDAAGNLIAIQDKLPSLEAARAFTRDALAKAASMNAAQLDQPRQSLNDDDIYVIDLSTRKIVEQHGSSSIAAHAMRSGAVWGVRPGQALVKGMQARWLLERAA